MRLDLSRLAALGLAGAALAGCDSMYGVGRQAYLREMPPLACVDAVVRAQTGVVDVQTQTMTGGRRFTAHGLAAQAETHYFYFRGAEGSNIVGSVYLTDDKSGTDQQFYFSAGLHALHESPPQAQIDATRPVMAAIERRLMAECGMAPLKPIREECIGVDCAPLEALQAD